MKRKMSSVLILICYSVPWVFLGMYGDFTWHSMLPYGLMILVMVGLGWYCGRTKRIPLALLGNLLSLAVSCLCTYLAATEQWNYFFKAFPAVIRTVQFSGLVLAAQLLPWWFRKVTE